MTGVLAMQDTGLEAACVCRASRTDSPSGSCSGSKVAANACRRQIGARAAFLLSSSASEAVQKAHACRF